MLIFQLKLYYNILSIDDEMTYLRHFLSRFDPNMERKINILKKFKSKNKNKIKKHKKMILIS